MRARELKFQDNIHPQSHVTCQVSGVRCQVSFFFFFWTNWWDSRWRVSYQRGLPCLVSLHINIISTYSFVFIIIIFITLIIKLGLLYVLYFWPDFLQLNINAQDFANMRSHQGHVLEHRQARNKGMRSRRRQGEEFLVYVIFLWSRFKTTTIFHLIPSETQI